jgi:hypothetical protein
MDSREHECPKCGGAMLRGFVPDENYGAKLIGLWHPGQPKRSFWTATKAPRSRGIPIGAFRCERCGYLEFYSNDEFAAE